MNETVSYHDREGRYSIDDHLGDSTARFFGSGYKGIRHEIVEVHAEPSTGVLAATAKLIYPKSWSKKNDASLEAHLSTLEGLAVAAQVCEAYLRIAFGFSDAEVSNLYPSSLTLKSGSAPTVDIARVPVSLRASTGLDPVEPAYGDLTCFDVKVGTMTVELGIRHERRERRQESFGPVTGPELLGPNEESYFGGAFRRGNIGLRGIRIDGSNSHIESALDVECPDGPCRGLTAGYMPYVSMTDMVVAAAQLSQVLMYRYDGISRDQSHNLWMRRVVMHAATPVAAGCNLHAQVSITKTSILDLKGVRWRVSRFSGRIPGLRVEHNLAHQLPEGLEPADAEAYAGSAE